ncbi:MAG TPA: bifunctional glutamate N-acetyltransferase/amino-acid acetyltransferase ArgJ [Gemmatales bacterium]|nr:bifunctional glutamate N-acetyltransferase/amino-acid acetyltransferase ArgJ [Gemmatales bacterium]
MTDHATSVCSTTTDPSTWVLAKGFSYSGIVSGLRSEPNRRDIGVILSEVHCSAAGVFTLNRVAAAPVQVSRSRVPSSNIKGIVCCSGNANACTGSQGRADAELMAVALACQHGVHGDEILVASTGIIGRPLPMSIVGAGVVKAAKAVQETPEALSDFAHSILTTDTVIKVATLEVNLHGTPVRFTGIAKGAAMIGPNMATMLGFILTDASIAPSLLQEALAKAVNRTFNCISVEGHMSTNDTVFALANGMSGVPAITGHGMHYQQFETDLTRVCSQLARAIAEDAEGATHIVELLVEGTSTEAEARQIAKTVAESPLVKTALFGADPNWGRIVSAAGYSGVVFEEKDLSLHLGPFLLYDKGTPVPFDEATVSKYMKDNRHLTARLTLNHGNARCQFWTCDLTFDYVKLNAEYTT